MQSWTTFWVIFSAPNYRLALIISHNGSHSSSKSPILSLFVLKSSCFSQLDRKIPLLLDGKTPSWSSFWKSCWTACVFWRAASKNAREGKSADWLSSVHCCSDWFCQAGLWGPWSRWPVLRSTFSPLLPPPFYLGCSMPTNMSGIRNLLPERRRLSSTNRQAHQLWAHRCEPMKHTCFLWWKPSVVIITLLLC